MMKTSPLMIGLLGAWSYGMMAPSLSDTNMNKHVAEKNKSQYERTETAQQKPQKNVKTPTYKFVERTK